MDLLLDRGTINFKNLNFRFTQNFAPKIFSLHFYCLQTLKKIHTKNILEKF
jgi:hypothetical protein